MPYYAPSAYYPLPGSRQAGAPPPQPQQQYAPPAQLDQATYLRQQAQAQAQAEQLAYQQQQLQQQQIAQQQQLAQQQYYQQQQQLQQQQYAAQQQQRLQQQQYAQQQSYTQQYQQASAPARQQQQRSGYQAAPLSPAAPQYKSSEYVQAGGVYSTGGAYAQPLRRAASRADVNTAIENQEAPYQSFGQGQQRVSQYNPYANYGQSVPQSPLRPQSSTQREPSEYAYDGLNPIYRQQAQQQQQYATQDRDLPTAREQPSASNAWLGARSLNTPTTVVLDANNNVAAAPLPPRSPARGYGAQKGYGSGQVESAYIGIPNDLVYAQNNQQRAYTYAQESRPAYASSSRTNQSPSATKLKPAAARELYAALSSENVRTALERDAPILAQAPAYSIYNGQKVQGRAFVIPADQKYSEYNVEDLNGLRSCIDR